MGWSGSCRQAGRECVVRSARLLAGPCSAHNVLLTPALPRPAPGLQWTVHPWADSSCNQLSVEDQLRGLQIPDVHPADLVPGKSKGECLGECRSSRECQWRAIWGQGQSSSRRRFLTAQHSRAQSHPASCASCCAAPGLLSMSAGDFAEVYGQPESAGAGVQPGEESGPLPRAQLLPDGHLMASRGCALPHA